MGPHEDGENRDSGAVMNMSPADPGDASQFGRAVYERAHRAGKLGTRADEAPQPGGGNYRRATARSRLALHLRRRAKW